MTTTQIVFLFLSILIAGFQIFVLWFVHQVSKQFPRIRKADSFDGEVEHG